ncbi:MAG: Dna2/Cas4 domain-containing protein, partial [Clostridia bacterium]
RWGLMELECDWVENYFVVRGNLAHTVTNSGYKTSSRHNIVERSVRVYNDEWNIFGVIDNLELKYSDEGAYIRKYDNRFNVCIVEYKVTAPKNQEYRREDAMQLLAQKICVDSLFNTQSETVFYYADTKKRIKVNFTETDYDFLKQTLFLMRQLKERGVVPDIMDKQYCSGCSFKDICMPKLLNKRK